MNTLNLGSDEMPEKKKKSNTRNLKIALGLAAVILVPTIGSTLAGSITVGTGTLEFGQGVVTTAACDDAITVTPESALVGAAFVATAIAVSNIGDADCTRKIFTIKALNSSNTAIINCRFNFGATGVATTMAADNPGTCNVYTDDSATTGMSFTFRHDTSINSSDIEKITLESSNS
jgi:hypothetical protein